MSVTMWPHERASKTVAMAVPNRRPAPLVPAFRQQRPSIWQIHLCRAVNSPVGSGASVRFWRHVPRTPRYAISIVGGEGICKADDERQHPRCCAAYK